MNSRIDLSFATAHMNSERQVSDVVYHPTGESLYTCGSDGISVFQVTTSGVNPDAKRISTHTDEVNALAINKLGDQLASCSSDHTVHIYKNNEFEKNVTKFQLSVRHVAFDPQGQYLASGGDDGTIRVVLVHDTQQMTQLKEHQGAIRSLAYDPKGDFLASTACDGTLRIWNTEDNKQVHVVKDIIQKGDTSDNLFGRISWHPLGNYLAVTGQKEVKVLERGTWKVAFSLSGHIKPTTLVAYSPNGRYLATCGIDFQVIIWDLATKHALQTFKHNVDFSGLSWSPSSNTLALIDVDGRYSLWYNPVPSSHPSPFSAVTESNKVSAEENDSDDEIQADLLETDEQVEKERKLASELGEDEVDDFIESDDEVAYQAMRYETKPKKKAATTSVVPVSSSIFTVPPQSAFQPGSTFEKKRRYLVFNKIGSIIARDEHTHTSLEIDFHDTSKHRSIKVIDRNNVSMGVLGNKGAAFANKAVDGVPSTVAYHPIESWGTNPKWSVPLPADEEIEALAICDGFVAIATTKMLLRIFTFTGIQYQIVSLPGPVVAMSGHANTLVVTYHHGSPLVGSQNIQYMLMDLKSRKVISKETLPLSSKTTLKWIGFTPMGILSACDSNGVVRMLLDEWQQWTPVATIAVNHWIFGASEKSVNCLVLKSEETSPSVSTRPIPTTVPLSIPLLQSELETTKHEEIHLRERLVVHHKENYAEQSNDPQALLREKAVLDTYIMKMIESAIRTEKSEKALNLCDFIQFEKPLLGVINLATQKNIRNLAEKMSELHAKKFRQQEEEESEEEEEEENEPMEIVKPTMKRSESHSPISADEDQSDEEKEEPTTPKGLAKMFKGKEEKKQSPKDTKTANTESNGQKKKNRFVKDKPVKTGSVKGNLFEALGKLQDSANDPSLKKRKLQSIFM